MIFPSLSEDSVAQVFPVTFSHGGGLFKKKNEKDKDWPPAEIANAAQMYARLVRLLLQEGQVERQDVARPEEEHHHQQNMKMTFSHLHKMFSRQVPKVVQGFLHDIWGNGNYHQGIRWDVEQEWRSFAEMISAYLHYLPWPTPATPATAQNVARQYRSLHDAFVDIIYQSLDQDDAAASPEDHDKRKNEDLISAVDSLYKANARTIELRINRAGGMHEPPLPMWLLRIALEARGEEVPNWLRENPEAELSTFCRPLPHLQHQGADHPAQESWKQLDTFQWTGRGILATNHYEDQWRHDRRSRKLEKLFYWYRYSLVDRCIAGSIQWRNVDMGALWRSCL
ncbi:unnamed protein product [Amoebophrya sp. A25]|nr:unnamed protein product [Amoebophrya sp. A25]|eukprot:GSA25T00008747001.1